MEDKYKLLCELQAECNALSIKDSIKLTEIIKTGVLIDAVIFLMKLLIKNDTN
ncbi:MAG: hypothetical protein GY870_09200 [archaeon]|nr:hypothetical protein [archaeon]